MATDRPLCDRSLPCYPLPKTAAVWTGNVSRQHKGLGVSTFGPQSPVLTWKAMDPYWGGPHWEDVVCWGQALRPYSPTLRFSLCFLISDTMSSAAFHSSHRECPAFPQKVTLIIALLVNLTQPRTKRSSGRGGLYWLGLWATLCESHTLFWPQESGMHEVPSHTKGKTHVNKIKDTQVFKRVKIFHCVWE